MPVLMLAMAACTDDLEVPSTVDVPEGEDTKISLTLQAPEMSRLESRADMSEADANNVQSLWVGIYNASTGQSTLSDNNGYGLLIHDGEHGFTQGQKNHTRYELRDINTKSGRSYIVAVANPDLNQGYKLDENGNPGTKTTLSTLLSQAATWDDFLSIVIERPLFQSAAVLGVPNETPLPMSGIYVDAAEGAAPTDPADWTKVEPFQIPLVQQGESLTLNGAIHLRRPYTQVKFNVSVANESEESTNKIVSFDVESYRVYNVPTYGWLYERSQGDNLDKRVNYANAGDAMNPTAAENGNYKPSLTFVAPEPAANGVCTFDFWMMENKRTGLADFIGDDYQKREVEYKNGDGTNTGVYESLCPSNEATLNNFASYVEIRGTLTYNLGAGGSVVNPENPNDPNNKLDLPNEVASRTVEVTYTVHLGNVNGVATDFNNYRNSKYTYNVKVRSANSIIVEAFLEDQEPQPGAEGIVTDVTNRMFNVDAHSEVFNIYLTTDEISDFSFTMRSYYNNEEKVIYQNKKGKDGTAGANNVPEPGDADFKFYDWIELVPTDITTEDKDNELSIPIAKFPDLTEKGTDFRNLPPAQRGFYYLHELQTSGLPGQYFTVYVNEHTYVPRYGDENWGNEVGNNWHAYVNTNKPRQAWFNVSQETSKDGQNVYYRSKYALSQQSIQTYYDMSNTKIETALGLEHVNESFGMNIRWTVPVTNSIEDKDKDNYADPNNGRYNVWHLGLEGENKESIAKNKWDDIVNLETRQTINSISNKIQMNPAAGIFTSSPKNWNVPMQKLLSTDVLTNYAGSYNGSASQDYDPQSDNDAQFIEALHACMNRNRDENGDGVIDAAELKWYLPASGKYARMILGRRTLTTPIMNYTQDRLPFACTNGQNTLYHFIASDNIIVWADEGMSSSSFYGQNSVYSYAPWQIRCIRNFGTDLRTVSTGEKVTPAYDDKSKNLETGGGVVKVNAYYGAALRDPVTTYLPMHKSNSQDNAIGRYGFEVAVVNNGYTNNPNKNTPEASANTYKTSYENYIRAVKNYYEPNVFTPPCYELNKGTRKGWRIPNQSEIVIMRRMGVLKPTNILYGYMTCTQEYYSTKSPYKGSNNTGPDYRILTSKEAVSFAIPYNDGNMQYVRCVRDLTAEEANMTYEQILAR